MMASQNPTDVFLIEALSSLTPSQFTDLTNTISALLHRHHRRLFSLLSSPTLFSLTLHHLHSLSLHHKSLLIARYLLSNLTILTHFIQGNSIPPPYAATSMKLRDLDAVLLLLLLCELRQHDQEVLDAPPSCWRGILCQFVSDTMLRMSTGFRVSGSEVLIKYIEEVAKCKNFVHAMCCAAGGKEAKEAAASVAVVVALPSVEVCESGKECVICKEEMMVGRDVCKLPCDHLFHWMCILPWLQKRNTCPCCRNRLPTEDVFDEIQRLWELLAKLGRGYLYGEYSCS